MALNRPDNRDKASAAPPPDESAGVKGPAKKAQPTPSRREAEIARRQRLTPTVNPKEERARVRRINQANRMKVMESSEAKPERVLVRNYIDHRWNVGEFMLPVMILVMAITLIFGDMYPALVSYIAFGTWFLLFLVVIDLWVMWNGYKKLLEARHPGTPTKGILSYAVNRAIQIRRFRVPGPVIKRGDEF